MKAPIPSIQEIENCPSCLQPFSGRYCSNCGEKKLAKEEMTLSYFFGSVWNAITFTDVKFLRSIQALIFKPGKLTAEFFAGRRKLFTAPLALFFFINLVYFVYQPVDALNSSLLSQTTGQRYSEWASGVVKEHIDKENISRQDFSEIYNHTSEQVSKLCLVMFIIFFAVGVSIVNVRRKALFYFHLITATHFISFTILTTLIILPFLAGLVLKLYLILSHQNSMEVNPNAWYITLPILLMLGTYAYYMQKRLYAQGFIKNLLKTVLLIVAFAAAALMYRFFLFVVTMMLV